MKGEEAENAAAEKAAAEKAAAEKETAGITAADESTAGIHGAAQEAPSKGAPAREKSDAGEDKFDRFMRRVLGDNYFQYLLYTSVAFALVLGIGLFMLLPNFVTDLFHFDKTGARGSFVANLIEGAIRLTLFFAYIWFVSRNKEIHRVFQYHGAEHKSIYTLEQGEALTVENARRHTTLHPRCGTAFLFVVMIISIIVFMFAGWHSRIMNLVIRLVLLPVIAGISYEVFKMAAKSPLKPLRALSFPGLMLQKITTQEPDDSMLEVALTALRAVVGEEASAGTVDAAGGTGGSASAGGDTGDKDAGDKDARDKDAGNGRAGDNHDTPKSGDTFAATLSGVSGASASTEMTGAAASMEAMEAAVDPLLAVSDETVRCGPACAIEGSMP